MDQDIRTYVRVGHANVALLGCPVHVLKIIRALEQYNPTGELYIPK